jgi:hypothetical protein
LARRFSSALGLVATDAGAAGQAAAEDLRERGHVGRHAELLLGAARRHAEAGDDLVEDQERSGAPRLFTQRGQEGRGSGHRAEVSARRLDDHDGHVALREALANRGDVVGRQHCDQVHHLGELARLGLGCVGRAHADFESFVPAVEVSGELHDVLLAREGPGQAHCHVGGLGARCRKAHALGARHEPVDPLAPLDLLRMAGAIVRAMQRLLAHGLHDRARIVPEEERAVAHPVVDVAVAVHVPLVGALRPIHIERERLHAAVVVGHRVGKEPPGALVQLARGGERGGVAILDLRGID